MEDDQLLRAGLRLRTLWPITVTPKSQTSTLFLVWYAILDRADFS